MTLKLALNTRILLICVLSLIWIILYKFIFINIESIFPRAAEIAELVFNLLISTIASGIFYYIVVHLEQRRIAKTFYPSLNERLKTFGVGALIIKTHLFELNGKNYNNESLHAGDIMALSKNIKLSSQPPIIFGNPSYVASNWYDYFDYFFQSDKFLSNQLYTHINFLTPDILKELDSIQYSHFQRALNHYKNSTHDELSGLGGPFWLYLTALEKLGKKEFELN